MPVLPVPMIIAMLLLGLLIHRMFVRETHATLLALIAVCALQSTIIALLQYYGLTALRPLQPLLATFIPPIAWLAFKHASGAVMQSRRTAWHALGPASAAILLILYPTLLDVLIPLSFAGYGAAVLLGLRHGEDSLPHSRLQGGAMPLLAWAIIGLSLIASAGSDMLISYGMARGERGMLFWLPSLFASLSLLSLGALSLSRAIESQRDCMTDDEPVSQFDIDRRQAIIAKLDEHMRVHRPFVDPDLTLARLARKLAVPAKQLSAAINHVKGENVSRYVNRQRIEDACGRLMDGQSVTNAMLESGFNTKSNFNREFLRVKGISPSKWLQDRKHSLKA